MLGFVFWIRLFSLDILITILFAITTNNFIATIFLVLITDLAIISLRKKVIKSEIKREAKLQIEFEKAYQEELKKQKEEF